MKDPLGAGLVLALFVLIFLILFFWKDLPL